MAGKRGAAWGLALAFSMLTTVNALALPQSVSVPVQQVPGSRMPDKPLTGMLSLPAGNGPFPAVILLHGCGGMGPALRYWVDRLNDWGYAVLQLDSFAARGVKSVCSPANQPLVTGVDRAGDVMSAALYLRSLPQIDGNRIGVLGESHGGGTAVTATRAQYQTLYPGLLKASVDYYGPCRDPGLHGTVPLLVLAGDADTWGNPAAGCTRFGEQLRSNQPFEIKIYPGAVHAFDNPNLRNGTVNQGHPLRYDAAAAADSFVVTKAFLDKYLKGSS